MIVVKIHRDAESYVVAVCDKALIGKCFEEGDLCLDVSERFYSGEEMGADELFDFVEDAKTVNIVGEESVKLFVDRGVISEKNINKVKSVPFAIVC